MVQIFEGASENLRKRVNVGYNNLYLKSVIVKIFNDCICLIVNI